MYCKEGAEKISPEIHKTPQSYYAYKREKLKYNW